jgi:hypothetical protein
VDRQCIDGCSSFLINYWWNAVRRPVVAAIHSLLHGVIAIANLPSPQRDVWKSFFDHYVFQVHGDPAEHIAPERRGLLGSLSPWPPMKTGSYLGAGYSFSSDGIK